jgi:hypothetical protein
MVSKIFASELEAGDRGLKTSSPNTLTYFVGFYLRR